MVCTGWSPPASTGLSKSVSSLDKEDEDYMRIQQVNPRLNYSIAAAHLISLRAMAVTVFMPLLTSVEDKHIDW